MLGKVVLYIEEGGRKYYFEKITARKGKYRLAVKVPTAQWCLNREDALVLDNEHQANQLIGAFFSLFRDAKVEAAK